MGLLTLKAFQLITEYAEVVIYDRLLSDDILALIPEHVERVYAGKSSTKHVMTQDEINASLLTHAQNGKRVIRLKGGDPTVFGRGSEEAMHLIKHHVPCEMVPGISAAQGIACSAGIPLTHRGVASSVQFITGHKQNGELIDHDWHMLVSSKASLVVYMGLGNFQLIREELSEHGMPLSTPAAAIQNGTMPNEKRVFGTLETLDMHMRDAGLEAPVTLFIGDVVNISLSLNQGKFYGEH